MKKLIVILGVLTANVQSKLASWSRRRGLFHRNLALHLLPKWFLLVMLVELRRYRCIPACDLIGASLLYSNTFDQVISGRCSCCSRYGRNTAVVAAAIHRVSCDFGSHRNCGLMRLRHLSQPQYCGRNTCCGPQFETMDCTVIQYKWQRIVWDCGMNKTWQSKNKPKKIQKPIENSPKLFYKEGNKLDIK